MQRLTWVELRQRQRRRVSKVEVEATAVEVVVGCVDVACCGVCSVCVSVCISVRFRVRFVIVGSEQVEKRGSVNATCGTPRWARRRRKRRRRGKKRQLEAVWRSGGGKDGEQGAERR